MCSQTELKLRTREEEANATLKQWQETGKLPTADVLARLVTARHEVNFCFNSIYKKKGKNFIYLGRKPSDEICISCFMC